MGTPNRLRKCLNEEKINDREADDLFGFSNGLTGNFLAGKTVLGVDKIANILAALPELNGDWLLTGRGSMTVSENLENITSEEPTVYKRGTVNAKQIAE